MNNQVKNADNTARDFINSRPEAEQENIDNLVELGAQWDTNAFKNFFKKAAHDTSTKITDFVNSRAENGTVHDDVHEDDSNESAEEHEQLK